MAKIVLADDDEGLRRVLRRHLVFQGHDVREAADGAEAFLQLEQDLPEFLLTDLVMPEHEGIELITRTRRRWPALPIIAMSGGGPINAPDRYLTIAKALGAAMLLVKPFRLASLDDAIERSLHPDGAEGADRDAGKA